MSKKKISDPAKEARAGLMPESDFEPEPEEKQFDCPKCHNSDSFSIVVTQDAEVDAKGEVYDVRGDVEWDADSEMMCLHCDHQGKVRYFEIKED